MKKASGWLEVHNCFSVCHHVEFEILSQNLMGPIPEAVLRLRLKKGEPGKACEG